jgi:hypothetical protein
MKMSTIVGKVMAISALTSAALIASAQNSGDAGKMSDFSATQAASTRGQAISMKIYRSGTSIRYEPNPAISMIYMPDDQKVYKIMGFPDGSHQCVVARTDQSAVPGNIQLLAGSKTERTPAGTETVDGHVCRVSNVVVTRSDGKTTESKLWEAEDRQRTPIKIETQTEDGAITITYRDIVLGPPDPALFKLPAKCTPLEKMGQVAPPGK